MAIMFAVVACSSGQAPAPTAAPAKPAAAEPTKAAAPASQPTTAAVAQPTAAAAQPTAGPKVDYPPKTVTFIAPSKPGSGFDTTARAIASTLEKEKLIT